MSIIIIIIKKALLITHGLRSDARHRGAFSEGVVTGNLLVLVILFTVLVCVWLGRGYVSKHTCIDIYVYIYIALLIACR